MSSRARFSESGDEPMVTVVSLRGDASYTRNYVSKKENNRNRSLARRSGGVVSVRVCVWCVVLTRRGLLTCSLRNRNRNRNRRLTTGGSSQVPRLGRQTGRSSKYCVMTNERMRRVIQRPAVWEEGVSLVQKCESTGRMVVDGWRWSAGKKGVAKGGAPLSVCTASAASLDLPSWGSGHGRKP